MGDAPKDAARVSSQAVRLREEGQAILVVQEEAKAIVNLMREKGVTLEDLLAGLEEERAAIYEARYGVSL